MTPKNDYVALRKIQIQDRTYKALGKLQNPQDNIILENYIKDLSSRTKGSTIPTYIIHLVSFANYKKTGLKSAKAIDVKGYLGFLKQNDKSPPTMRLAYNSIMDFNRYLEGKSKKEIPSWFKRIDGIKVTRKETEPLDFDTEIKPMINAFPESIRNQAIVHVLYEAMLRKMELLALRVKDIDLSKKPSPVKIRLSKTERGKNRPTFIYNAIPVLKKWLNEHPLRGSKDFQDAPLFVNLKRGPISERSVEQIINNAGRRAGIKRSVYCHLLRHSRAYELAQVYNFQPQELMKMGGWQNSTMLDVYYNPQSVDIKNKLLNGHGITTITEQQRQEALKERKIRLCACGHENSFDKFFCEKCGIILNIKGYQKEMKGKDSEIEVLKQQIQDMPAQILELVRENRENPENLRKALKPSKNT